MNKLNSNRFIFFIFISIILLSCKSQQTAEDLGIIDLEFEIVSIYIIQADLVNTQFEAVLKIDNPNNFNAELSSINYELYGNGMLWAEGTAENTILVPAEGFSETRFRFSMNFINMNRSLLDDVINMRRVQYRFKGNAQVRLSMPRHLRPFTINFDISGLSDVKPKAD